MKKTSKLLAALLAAALILSLAPMAALAKLKIEFPDDAYVYGTVIKNGTPLKNSKGKTMQKLDSGDEIIIEEIDGETYWVEYGGYFHKIAASNVAVNYPENLYGEALRKTYGLDPRSGKRINTYIKGDEFSVAGREGKYLLCDIGDGYVRVLAKDVFMNGETGQDF